MTDFLEKLSVVLGSTRVFNVTVTATTTIQADYSAIVGSPNSRIGVWSGNAVLGNPIVAVPATATSGTVTLTAQGWNFNEGPYTIGFVVDANSSNNSSIAATVLIINGQYVLSQTTSLFVTNQRNYQGSSYLTINYSTPDGNTPNSNLDWIDLFKGSAPVNPQQSSPIQHLWIPTNNNSGTVTLQVTPPLTYQAPYVIEYNPGSTTSAVSAYYTFQFSGQ